MNYFEFEYNNGKAIAFILDTKLHQIHYKNNELFCVSIKTNINDSDANFKLIISKGEIKSIEDLKKLREFILTKI